MCVCVCSWSAFYHSITPHLYLNNPLQTFELPLLWDIVFVPFSDQSLVISNVKQSRHLLLSKEPNKTEASLCICTSTKNAECQTMMACRNWARPLQQGALASGEVMVGAPATFLCLCFYINISSSSWVECDLYSKPNCEAQRKERCKSENWKCDSVQWFFLAFVWSVPAEYLISFWLTDNVCAFPPTWR